LHGKIKMIDREARNTLAEQIRHFLAGLSDNFKFDDIVFDIKTNDVAVLEMRKQLWYTYDDFARHKLKGKWELSEKDKDTVNRFVLFLKTDFECSKFNKSTDRTLWPFSSIELYERARAEPKYLNKAT